MVNNGEGERDDRKPHNVTVSRRDETTQTSAVAVGRVRDRLHSMLRRHEAGVVCVQPGELSVAFRGPWQPACASLFLFMAYGVIHRKYEEAARPRVAACVLEAQARLPVPLGSPSASACAVHPQDPTIEGRLRTHYRRLGNYRSRCDYGGDPDLHVCAGRHFWDLGPRMTPWVFQQDDLRYRWTETSLLKLRYLADCWDAYSRCGFTPTDASIGEADFPASKRLRADLPHSRATGLEDHRLNLAALVDDRWPNGEP